MSSMLTNVLRTNLVKSLTIFPWLKSYFFTETFPIHQPTWGLFSRNTSSIHSPSTQGTINYTVLWVGEACKEMEWEHSILGSKRIQRICETSLNPTLTPTLSLAYIPLPSCPWKKVSFRTLKTLQLPIFLMKFCILCKIRKCHSLRHKHRDRVGISDLLLCSVRIMYLRCLSCMSMLNVGEENVCRAGSLAPRCLQPLDSGEGFSSLIGQNNRPPPTRGPWSSQLISTNSTVLPSPLVAMTSITIVQDMGNYTVGRGKHRVGRRM